MMGAIFTKFGRAPATTMMRCLGSEGRRDAVMVRKVPMRTWLTGAVSGDHRPRGREQDLQVGPERVGLRVLQVEADHFVEGRPAAAGHLPEAGDARLRLEHAALMPRLVLLYFVRQR